MTDLALGNHLLHIRAPGLPTRPVPVTIQNGDEIRLDITLELGEVMGEFSPVEPAVAAISASRPSPPEPKKRHRWWLFGH